MAGSLGSGFDEAPDPLEYMDVEYELDVDEINSRWERGYGEDEVWGQLMIWETSPDLS
jgi:hypothetical protein